MLDCYIKDYHHHHHHEQFEDDLYSFRIANERVHAFCQMVHTNNNNNERLDTKLQINTTTIGDKRVRYREYCQRLYSDNDEAISQIWEWKENVKRNISGTNYDTIIIISSSSSHQHHLIITSSSFLYHHLIIISLSSLYYYYYHAIIDVSVAKIKALSDIDLSFLLTSTRFPS
jgi:hypothetical protein